MWLKGFVKDAIKVTKLSMENVFKLIFLIARTEDVKLGKMEFILNVQEDGSSMKMVFVLQLMTYVILGLIMEIAKVAIKAMKFKKELVLEVKISDLLQMISVLNGKI